MVRFWCYQKNLDKTLYNIYRLCLQNLPWSRNHLFWVDAGNSPPPASAQAGRQSTCLAPGSSVWVGSSFALRSPRPPTWETGDNISFGLIGYTFFSYATQDISFKNLLPKNPPKTDPPPPPLNQMLVWKRHSK